jgi:hypothetical protein
VAIEDSKVTTRDEAESSPGEPKEKENSEDAAFRSLAVAFAGLARAFLLGLGKFGFTKGALRIALKKRAFLTIGSRTALYGVSPPALHFDDGFKPKQHSNNFSGRAAGEFTAFIFLGYRLIRSYQLTFSVCVYRKPLSRGACWVLLCSESMIS